MFRLPPIAAVAIGLGISTAALAQDVESTPKIVVIPLRPLPGVENDVSALLTDTLTIEMGKLGRYEVMSPHYVRALIGSAKVKEAVGCQDVSCAAEIGSSLGADLVITGKVGMVADHLELTLILFDTKAMKAINRVKQTAKSREALCDEGVVTALRGLVGVYDSVAALPPAPKAAGFVDKPAPATDPANAPEAPNLEPAIYQRWWFWTAVGVVAVSAGLLASAASSESRVGTRYGLVRF